MENFRDIYKEVLKELKESTQRRKNKGIFDELIKELKQSNKYIYNRILNKLRKSRKLSNKQSDKVIKDSLLSSKLVTIKDVVDNEYIDYFTINIKQFINHLLKTILTRDEAALLQLRVMYFVYDPADINDDINSTNNNVYLSPAIPIQSEEEIDNLILQPDKLDRSNLSYKIVGYTYMVFSGITSSEEFKESLDDYRAFNPSEDKKFHQLTTASTGFSKLCIYETYLHNSEKLNLKSMRQGKKKSKYIKELLSNEPEELKTLIKEGRVHQSLLYLSKQYPYYISNIKQKIPYILTFYDSNRTPLIYENGTFKEEYPPENLPCFLYDSRKEHIAPSKTKSKENNQKIKTFALHPITDIPKTKVTNILAYDIETYQDNNKAIPFCICLKGILNNTNINESFYGENAINEFIDYLFQISTKKYVSKTNPKQKIPKIFIYSFNGAKFDNIFIYKKIYDRLKSVKIIHQGTSIKYIRFYNITILDLHLFYAGSLDFVAGCFQLPIKKTIYPYKFPNKSNLYYVGEKPDKQYFKNEQDYNELNLKEFNMKEYTINYCFNDTDLTFQIAKLHLDFCIGEININNKQKPYNIQSKPTAASLALALFQQTGLEKSIWEQSLLEQSISKEMYHGGRTEVFKKQAKIELYGYDINSSYPAVMFNNSVPISVKENSYRKLNKPVKLTTAQESKAYKVTYKSNNSPSYICNALHNVTYKNSKYLISTKEVTTPIWLWGNEIIELIKDKNEITCYELIEYNFAPIFKDFINAVYNLRLQAKQEKNEAKTTFLKLIMNSLYGKFGQNPVQQHALCKTKQDILKKVKNISLLRAFEQIEDSIFITYEDPQSYHEIGTLTRIASYITSKARTNLHQAMREVGFDNIYYCDTDSIYTSKKLPNEYISQTILGKWKLEHTIKEAYFLAPKMYGFEEIRKTSKKEISKKIDKEENITLKDLKGKVDIYSFDVTDEDEIIDNKIQNMIIRANEIKAKGINSNKLTINDLKELSTDKQSISQTVTTFTKKRTEVIIKDTNKTIVPTLIKRNFQDNNSSILNNDNEFIQNLINRENLIKSLK